MSYSSVARSKWAKILPLSVGQERRDFKHEMWYGGGLGGQRVKNVICKSLNRKPSNSSFSSAWCNDFKNVIFEKNQSPLQGRWGLEVIFEVAEAKFWISSNFHRFSLQNFRRFEFEVVWPQRPQKAELVGFQTMVILDPYDMTFDAVGVFGLAFHLFKSYSSYSASSCPHSYWMPPYVTLYFEQM